MSDTPVRMAYGAERDLDAWRARHAAGESPSEWPYGLEYLARPGATVTPRSLPQPGRFGLEAARLLHRRPSSRTAGRAVGISWDENIARRLLASARQREELYSGVIWLTDVLRKGDPSDYRRTATLLHHFSGLFVLSRAQLDPLREFLGSGAPPVHFVRFGVDADFFTPAPYPGRPALFSAGGDRDRDTETLFEALRAVRAQVPDAEIVVQTKSEATPPDGVRVIPYVTHAELRERYRAASAVLIATRENLHVSGMTVSLEAMATARPVVLTGTPGTDDYVAQGETGYLVPRGDAAALAARAVELLADPAASAAMGERGRAAVEDQFTTRHLADQLAALVGI